MSQSVRELANNANFGFKAREKVAVIGTCCVAAVEKLLLM